MKLALALKTTPDEFLIGSVRHEDNDWQAVADLLRGMNVKQLEYAKCFLQWLSEQKM